MLDFCPNCFQTEFLGKCSSCGYLHISNAGMDQVLPAGTILGGTYLVGRVLGAGGFGITYIAKNMITGQIVAIKEYMPTIHATRASDGKTVIPVSSGDRQLLEQGVESFNKEAITLKNFIGNPHIVQVYDSFIENSTSYFSMEYLDGITLGGLFRASDHKIPLATALEVLTVTSNTLKSIHDKGMLHRDVSPDNIYITRKGEVKLIDFGATRFFVGEKSRSLSVVLKAGFAPPEQYSSKGNQGPWTDLYALCATFYTIVVGNRLADAPDRMAGTPIDHLSKHGVPNHIANSIERGLALDFRQRYQNMEQFLKEIQNNQVPSQPTTSQTSSTDIPSRSAENKGVPYVMLIRTNNTSDRWLLPKNMPLIIGRSNEKCNIVLDNINVSRVHCEIRYDENSALFYLKDLSTNGTFVAGGRLNKGQYHPLKAGETFYVLDKECTLEVGLC